ncbi:MAG: hypothetical protein GX025_04320, partial [Clostridiales bacterium]|nr:hypothetical protein [Clostridiales bacterium]
ANYDITHIFIDNFLKMLDETDMDKIASLLEEISAFGEKEGIRFTISATGDPNSVGENISKYF